MKAQPAKLNAKEKILNAALSVIRSKGYSGTTVDDLCEAAKVTKGAFFHHFESKEDLAVSAANHWSQVTSELFAHARYHQKKDPLDRLMGYLELRKELVQGEIPEFTCFVGTMVQEIYDTNPKIRNACQKSIVDHSATVAVEIEAAKKLYVPKATFTAEGLALHIQAVIQGAFILAKAQNNPKVAVESINHLKSYIEFIFNKEKA